MICTCKACGGSVVFEAGDAVGVCRDCGARQAIEKEDIYREAERLTGEDTEESLEQAMLLYRSIRGWQDADRRYVSCRTRLGQLRWKVESARLKAEEERNEARVARWKKIAITVLIAVLLILTAVSAVTLIQYQRYNKAAEYYTAGEYESAAAAFQKIGNYLDAKTRVFLSAVELYKAKRYAQALPYFEWLNGYIDNGYYLNKCRERLAAPAN